MSTSLEIKSINDFNQEEVTKDTLSILLASANKPSTNGKGPKFITVQNKETLMELEAALDAVIEGEEEHCNIHKAPVLVLAANERDEEGLCDCSEDTKHFVYLAHVLGLEFYRVNVVRKYCDKPQVRNILTKLGIPENYFIYSSIAFGYVGEIPQLGSDGRFW